jgi:hypothetical protein
MYWYHVISILLRFILSHHRGHCKRQVSLPELITPFRVLVLGLSCGGNYISLAFTPLRSRKRNRITLSHPPRPPSSQNSNSSRVPISLPRNPASTDRGRGGAGPGMQGRRAFAAVAPAHPDPIRSVQLFTQNRRPNNAPIFMIFRRSQMIYSHPIHWYLAHQ